MFVCLVGWLVVVVVAVAVAVVVVVVVVAVAVAVAIAVAVAVAVVVVVVVGVVVVVVVGCWLLVVGGWLVGWLVGSCFPHSEALHSYMSYVVYKHYFRKNRIGTLCFCLVDFFLRWLIATRGTSALER